MKPFLTRILVCLIPCLIAAAIVGIAFARYESGDGGFKLGVDLVGGTILVYEVDAERSHGGGEGGDTFDIRKLAARLKQRIDPNDLYNVTIRPVSKTRIEIILPTGGAHQERIDEAKWQALLQKARDTWPDKLTGKPLDVSRGRLNELATLLESDQVASRAEIDHFLNENYISKGRKDVSGDEVLRIKELIKQVGSLEFRVLANSRDDAEALAAAKAFIDGQSDPKASEKERQDRKDALLRLAEKGLPPPSPRNAEGGTLFPWKTDNGRGETTYSWVELGRQERHSLGLHNDAKGSSDLWKRAEEARNRGEALSLFGQGEVLLYSRPSVNQRLSEDERKDKAIEYFLLTRNPPSAAEAITGEYLAGSNPAESEGKIAVGFNFNSRGADLFGALTTANKKSASTAAPFHRRLAILLDDMIVSAPQLNDTIRDRGVISGNFTKKEVDDLVNIFRAGALPATLKPLPVSENTLGATLGEDTIKSGTFSILLAFVAVLLFMAIYYRFAGLVACIALFANLLLTVAVMVLLNATFTLPGLAGLVLTLGMAVDANVLIYERLREERDRGASLALAIRNGYDRAFPTIIDTHLSSIFNAIVLYAVGNDQLKGFGVSLTVGLVISLFTSLYMTRLMFDLCLAKGWLTKLNMFRLLSNTKIDFMRIRYYWFAATIILTVLGITVFLIRGQNGLNIDFVGGTAYGGKLVEPTDIGTLRDMLSERSQAERLAIDKITETEDGAGYQIAYKDGTTQIVQLPNKPEGDTPEERQNDLKARAQKLPDLSVEQIFLKAEPNTDNKSRYFNVRTSEKAPELVQISIDRLLRDKEGKSILEKIDMKDALVAVEGKDDKGQLIDKWVPLNSLTDPTKEVKNSRVAILRFSEFASPERVKLLLKPEFQKLAPGDAQPFELTGISGDDPTLKPLLAGLEDRKIEQNGRYKLMKLTINDTAAPGVTPDKLKGVVASTEASFQARPQPERLENFDSQFALDTQTRAIYAIVLSWGATLLYLWFRFGSWTFGLAAVFCLIHDLFFTLGIIAFSHYIHQWFPGAATVLGLQDFKIDYAAVAALLTLVGYSVNDTIVVFDRIREVRGKNPDLTPQMINDSVNQTLSRTLLTAFSVWLVVIVLYIWGGEGVHLFAFVMVVGVIVGTYSSIYIASPLLLIFGEGKRPLTGRERRLATQPETASR